MTKHQAPSNQAPMTNLDEYFDRARREQAPLQKNDVSSILSEKLAVRTLSDDAHRRRKRVFPRNVGRFPSLLSPLLFPKGWIMFSMLTAALVALFLTFPNTRNTAPSGVVRPQQSYSQSLQQQQIQATKSSVTKPHATKHQAPSNQVPSNQVPSNQATDSLPTPYDVVEIDDEPFVDASELTKHTHYPEEYKKLGIEGQVTVRGLVLPNGKISPRSFVEYSDGKVLDSAALTAMFASRWQPATRGGKPVACWVSVPFHFRLNERAGKNRIEKAQMLTLSDEELRKIGVERDTADILRIYGWDKAHENLYQMKTSITSAITPKLMPDSVFKEYIRTLRKQGKEALADRWELTQWEHGKQALRDLFSDSIHNISKTGLVSIVSAQQQEHEKIERIRHHIFPRLVTDGHNFRYSIDVSDAPHLQVLREIHAKADSAWQQAKAQKLDSAQVVANYEKVWSSYRDKLVTPEQAKKLEHQFEQEKSDISKLIGIRVQSAQKRSEGDEYLLWYDPAPEFIALLPERYRVGLQREVETAKKYATTCEIPTEEEKKAVAGYFDSWRSCDGVLKITNLYPNPANIQATVRFTLREARSITLTLHNLNGERLAILEPTPLLPAGEHDLPLDFTGRNIGVYLLALSTDKGETAIKRVMIVR
ncbi:MAG: TonB family protein [Candidatus Kapaibacterium sp.]|nr:MAG: TonB family protein [Candidatus Kapabacteria bacterium]